MAYDVCISAKENFYRPCICNTVESIFVDAHQMSLIIGAMSSSFSFKLRSEECHLRFWELFQVMSRSERRRQNGCDHETNLMDTNGEVGGGGKKVANLSWMKKDWMNETASLGLPSTTLRLPPCDG